MEDTSTVQVRLGQGLLKRIDKAAFETGVSRNTWIAEAADKRLLKSNGKKRGRTSAAELMAHRRSISIRLDPVSLSMVDGAAKEEGVTRDLAARRLPTCDVGPTSDLRRWTSRSTHDQKKPPPVPPPDLRAVRAAALILKGWPAGGFYTTSRMTPVCPRRVLVIP